MLDNQLLKLLSIKDNYDKYREILPVHLLEDEGKIILDAYEYYWTKNPEDIDIDFNRLTNLIALELHPTWKADRLSMFNRIICLIEDEDIDEDVLSRAIELEALNDIKEVIDELANNKAKTKYTIDDVATVVDDYITTTSSLVEEELYYSPDIVDLLASVSTTGLEWKLQGLNDQVGSVQHGDFILIGKRPEVGGTSFLVSEFVHMALQLPDDEKAVIINNEEGKNKIFIRFMQAALDMSIAELLADPAEAKRQYEDKMGEKLMLVHRPGISYREIESILNNDNITLIGINTLENVAGYGSESEHKQLDLLGYWARKTADKYGPVFTIVQADYSAEGQMFLDQSQLYNSKTALQRHADIQLMIGKSHDILQENERYMNIVKKKVILGGTHGSGTHGGSTSRGFKTYFDSERCSWT